MRKFTYTLLLFFTAVVIYSCDDSLSPDNEADKSVRKREPITSLTLEHAEITLPTRSGTDRSADEIPNELKGMIKGSEIIVNGGDYYSEGNDLTGYLKYLDNINFDLLIGMECNGKKVILHNVRKCKVVSANGKSVVKFDESPFSTDRSTLYIQSDNYNGFLDEYKKNPENLKAFIAATAGGVSFDSQNYSTHYIPTQNVDPEYTNPINYRNSKYNYSKYNNNSVYITGVNEDGSQKGRDSRIVQMDIPLTSGKWSELNTNRIQFEDNNWKINLMDEVISLKPLGSLIGIITKNTSSLNNAYKNAWIDAIKIEKLEGTLQMPVVADVKYSNDWGNCTVVTIKKKNSNDDYSFFNYSNIILNSFYTGYMLASKYSRPLYFWVTGTGKIKITYNITVQENEEVVKYNDWYIDVYERNSQGGNGKKIGWLYGPADNTEKHDVDLSRIEEGKSYVVVTNNKEKVAEGLIISEVFLKGDRFRGYEGFTMVEVYNPSNHDIDLRNYGLIRLIGYDAYKSSGDIANYDINRAKVQNLYYDGAERAPFTGYNTFGEPVKNFGGGNDDEQKNNRYRVLAGNYDGTLGPKQTAIYCAGVWMVSNRDKELFKGNQAVYSFMNKAILDAINNNRCRFVVSVDNGGWYNGGQGGNTGILQIGWSGNALNGLALIQRNDVNSKWNMVDVIGLNKFDAPTIYHFSEREREIKEPVWFQTTLGDKVRRYAEKGIDFCFVRNNRKIGTIFDDMQSRTFKVGYENSGSKLGEDKNSNLWLVYPILNKQENVPYNGYSSSFGTRW